MYLKDLKRTQTFFLILCAFLLTPGIGYSQGCVKIVSGHKILTPTSGCVPFTFKVQNLYSNSTADTQYRIDWGDGTIETLPGSVDPDDFTPDFEHVYQTGSNTNCGYNVTIEAVNACTDPEDARFQVSVSVWDTDQQGLSISPAVINVCQGSAAAVSFADNSDWNCNPKSANENNGQRHIQWEYLGGTIDVSPAGTKSAVFPINSSGLKTATINVPAMNPSTGAPYQPGDEFVVKLNYWNYCNPYDDPNTAYSPDPGAADPGETAPVSTTARIRIVKAPDASFIVTDAAGNEKYSFCIEDPIHPRVSGSNLKYTWEFFGDQNGTTLLHTANTALPVYRFQQGGKKLIRLKVSPKNVAGTCETISERIIDIFPLAAARIGTSDAAGNPLDPVFCADASGISEQIVFTDISLNASVDSRRKWEFYDKNGQLYRTEPSSGSIDAPGVSFAETYNEPGVYRVRLILWDETAPECVSTDEKLIKIYTNPVTDYSYATLCNSTIVSFNDLSSLPLSIDGDHINLWEWDFNYDGISFTPDTSFTGSIPATFDRDLASAGSHLVALKASTATGTCSGMQVQNIELKNTALATFSADMNEGCSPLTVHFTNTAAGNQLPGATISEYRWLIDQGSGYATDSIQKPGEPAFTADYTRVFLNSTQQQKLYVVKLAAVTTDGCVAESEPMEIIVLPSIATIIDSDYNPLGEVCSPVNVEFTGILPNPSLLPDHYRWLIEDANGVIKDTLIDGNGNFTHTFINAGVSGKNFRVSFTAEKAGYCFQTSYQNIAINGSPSSAFRIEQVADDCNFVKYRLEAEQADLNYRWQINSVDYISKRFEISIPRPEAEDGDLEVPFTLTTTDPNTGCESPVNVKQVYVLKKENVDVRLAAVGDQDGCQPLTVDFRNETTGSPEGITFEVWVSRNGTPWVKWDPGSGEIDNRFTLRFDSTGIYQVQLRALTPSKCVFVSSPSQVITVYAAPKAGFAADKVKGCAPLTVSFKNSSQGSAPGRGGWFYRISGDPLYTRFSSDPDAAFTFENRTSSDISYEALYVAETAEGCADSVVQEIHVSPGVQPDFMIDPVVQGCTPLSLAFNNSQISANTVYVWNWGDGEPDDTTTTESQVLHTFYNPSDSTVKSFNITLKALDPISGCVNSATRSIKAYPGIRALVEPDVTEGCSPLSVNFTNRSSGASEHLWYYRIKGSDDRFEMTSALIPAYLFENKSSAEMIYEVVYEAYNAYGCSARRTFDIKVYPELRAYFTANPQRQTLPDRTITIFNATNEGSWIYEWDFGDGTGYSQLKNPEKYMYETYGVYEIKLSVKNGPCISEHSRIVVIEPTPPVVDFDCDPKKGCRPLTVSFFNLSTFADEDKFTWDFGDNQGKSTAKNPSYTYNQPGVYSVTLTASNKSGSRIAKEKKYLIEVYDNPYARFEMRPSKVFIPDMPVNVVNFTFGADSWLWDFGDGTTYTDFEPQHYYKEKGFYNVTLVARNEEGCVDTAYVESAAEAIEGGRISIPNVFTPNPDGPSGGNGGLGTANDVFLPLSEGVLEFRMQIFNRWGELLYETTAKDAGWDGYFKGKLCPQDVYIYRIELKFADGERTVKVGDVTLLR